MTDNPAPVEPTRTPRAQADAATASTGTTPTTPTASTGTTTASTRATPAPATPGPTPVTQPPAAANQVSVVLAVVMLAMVGQSILGPVVAPLARAVDLQEWQIGLTISAAALMVVTTAQFWGRRSQAWGRRVVLRLAVIGAFFASTGFALAANAGMAGAVGVTTLFILFLALRGVGFGAFLSALVPTAQAYIVDVTSPGPERVKGLAGLGAVQGSSMVVGALIGGVLAGTMGLRAPLFALPVMLVVGFVLTQFVLRPEPRHELVATPKRVSWRDERVFPFLAAGFGMFTGLGFIQLISGFIVQDRLHVAGDVASMYTGGVLLAAGLGIVAAQMVVVPRSGWTPPQLLRNGLSIALVGMVSYLPDWGLTGLVVSSVLMGFGMGIAMPGYSSGPTMLVRRDEQGGLAGLVSATNGLTFVISPALSTFLYGLWRPLPLIVGAVVLAASLALVVFHPRIRSFRPVLAD
ncbi:MFS transporter [Buchananella felis]|uniref:MFS transporter n=1 Tax=Buchananella felis TaxID=3231492 RepID=UPI0035285938